MWRITTPHYFDLSQAQDDLHRGFQPPTCWEPFVAATMLRRLEPPKKRIGPTTIRLTATIAFPPLDWVDPTIAATNSTIYVANHHTTRAK